MRINDCCKALIIAIAISCSISGATAQFVGESVWRSVPSGSGCSQATAFLGRTSGLNGTHTTAYTNLICGLVTDGVWSKLDALYVLRSQDSTTARLNLVSTSFSPFTVHGSPTFTADSGYSANSASDWLDTGYVPASAGGNYTQNSNHISFCSTVASNDGIVLGATDGTNFSEFFAQATEMDLYLQQGGSGPAVASGAPGAGFWLGARTASNAIRLDFNGSSVATNTTASGALVTVSFFILAQNLSGSPNATQTGIVTTAVSIGGSLSTTDSMNFHTRLSAYMAAIGSAAC